MSIVTNQSPKTKLDLDEGEKYHFGSHYTDHMFTVEWSFKNGWEAPKIRPYGPLAIPTSATVLHYGISCHEGASICRNKETGKCQGFRLDTTMQDFENVNTYLDLPPFDKNELIDCVKKLVQLDSHWIPNDDHYLYLRLNHFSMDPTLGVKAAHNTMITGILNPVMFSEHSLRSKCAFRVHRNWPLGHASMRLAGNFGPVLPSLKRIRSNGFNSCIWMVDDYMKELTTMNIFVLHKSRHGVLELITPPADGTVYNGTMRKSILSILKDF